MTFGKWACPLVRIECSMEPQSKARRFGRRCRFAGTGVLGLLNDAFSFPSAHSGVAVRDCRVVQRGTLSASSLLAALYVE